MLKRGLRWGVLPLALVALGVGWVATTTSGARWLVTTGAGLAGLDLRYTRLDGSLARGLDVADLDLRLPTVTLRADEASLRWQPLALARGAVAIDRLTLARGEVSLLPREEAAPSTGFRVPLPIDIAALALSDLAVSENGRRHVVEHATAALRAAGDRLTLREFDLHLPPHRVRGGLGLADGGEVFEVDLDYAGEPNGMPVAGTLKLAGPKAALETSLALTAPFPSTVDGTLNLAAASPVVDLRGTAVPQDFLAARGATVQVDPLGFTLRGAVETLALEVQTRVQPPAQPALAITLDVARLPAEDDAAERAALAWRVTPEAPLLGVEEFAGTGDVAWRDGRLELAQTLTAPSPLRLSAGVTPGANPVIDAQAEWETLALDLAGTPFRSPRGRLTLRGPWPGLEVMFDARVDDARLGPVDLTAQATVATERVDALRLKARVLGGEVEATGALTAFTPLAGHLDVLARELDLAVLRAGLDTRLGAAAGLTLADRTPVVDLARMDGRWRGQTFNARGTTAIDLNARRLDARDVAVSVGRNRLSVAGQAGETLALEFALDVPAAAELDAALAGRLQGKGTLRGTLAAPVLDATLDGDGLRAGAWAADSARLRASVSPQARSSVALDAAGVHQGDLALGALALAVAGTQDAHTVTLEAGSGARALTLSARGRWANARYDGRLQSLALAWPDVGQWRLDGETDFRYAGDALDLEPLCLAQAAARVCVDTRGLAATSGRVHATLTALPTALAAPWLPGGTSVDGTVSGDLAAERTRTGWRPQGRLYGTDVALVVADDGRDTRRWPIAPLTLAFEDVDDGQRFALALENAELGTLNANGTLGDLADTRTIDAVVRADARDLRVLAGLVPELAGSEGRVTLEASVQGALDAPTVQANAELAAGRISLERLGIALDELTLAGAMRGPRRIDLRRARGQGARRLTASGHVERAPQWPFSVRIDSERFRVLRRSDLELDIAPALAVSGTRDAVDIAGSLTVPRLRLRMQAQSPDAIAVSADEVILDEAGEVVPREAPESTAQRYWREYVSAALKLALGEDARVQALGLDAALTGALDFNKERGSPGFANGRIALKNGQYVAYRQKLELTRGELRFAGPLDNPSLDVLALRPKLDVKAGVVVTGTAQAPLVRLYSDPAMADLETLSYVVTGRPLGGTKRTNAELLTQAALGLGLEQAEGLTSQLRAWFGLDELGVNAGSTVEGTNFVAGKQLTPRMRVRSEFNPFDRLWSVFLNYRLTEHWSVEGESGARQGADVIYSIERDTLF